MKKVAFVVVLVAAIVGIVFGGLSMASASLPVGPNQPPYPTPEYKYVYTSGPFMLPDNPGRLAFVVLNNDSTTQTLRVTLFQGYGAPKTRAGIWVNTCFPGAVSETSLAVPPYFVYEVQVECNSQLVFPYVYIRSEGGGVIPGTGINSGDFIRQMP